MPSRFAGVRVDDRGDIRLPFAGRLRAAGRTPEELQAMIRGLLRGMSQDPQVMVSIDQSITNSVVLAGEVNWPGRFVLPTNRETLNETVALAGGYKGETKDVVARVERGPSRFRNSAQRSNGPTREGCADRAGRPDYFDQPAPEFLGLGAPNRAEQIAFRAGAFRSRKLLHSQVVQIRTRVTPRRFSSSAMCRRLRAPKSPWCII